MKLALQTTVAAFLFAGLALAQGGPGGPGGVLEDVPGHADTRLERNLVLPQVAVGPNISTSIVLLNWGNAQLMSWLTPDDLTTSGRILFFDSEGEPLDVQINGGDSDSEYPFTLQSSQMVRLRLTSDDETMRVGWALIEVDEDVTQPARWGMRRGNGIWRGERLSASAIFSVEENSQVTTQVGVIPSLFSRSRFLYTVLPVTADANSDTGVAVVNTMAEEAVILMRLRNLDGTLAGETEITLDGGNQTARFVSELFEQAPETFDGYMEVGSASDGIITMGILLNNGILTSIPTQSTGMISQGM